MGYTYKPPHSEIYMMQYYQDGRRIRESTRTTNKAEAERVLKAQEGDIAKGEAVIIKKDSIRLGEVIEDLREHYHTTGERNLAEADIRLKHLVGFFGLRKRIAKIGRTHMTAYAKHRQAAGVANATINRELAMLTKVLRHAYDNNKVVRVPRGTTLTENAPRSGFFEPEQFAAVRRHLPKDMQVAVTIAYTYGWRMQSEVLPLRRTQVDLTAKTLRLDPGTTKNDEGREVYLTPDLERLIGQQIARVDAVAKARNEVIPYLFPHLEGYRQGEPLRDFRKAWKSACRKAGVPWMLRHDFRRSAVRNLVNAGVSGKVAMQVTGHKTRSVFDRYHIVSQDDLKAASQKLAATYTATFGKRRRAKV